MTSINNLPSELVLNIAHEVAIIPNEGSKRIPKLSDQYKSLINSVLLISRIFYKASLECINANPIFKDINPDDTTLPNKFLLAKDLYKNLAFENYPVKDIINELEIPVMQHINYILFNKETLPPLMKFYGNTIFNLSFFNFGAKVLESNEVLLKKGISIKALSNLASTREGRFLLKNHYDEIINSGETSLSNFINNTNTNIDNITPITPSEFINNKIASFSKLVESDEGANLAIDKFDEVILWKDANISLLAHLYSSDKGKIFAQDNFDFIMQLNTRGANNIQMLFIPQLEDLVTAHKDIIINSEFMLIYNLCQLTKSDIGIVLLLNHDFTQILNIPLNQIQSLTNAINNNALNYEQAQLELNKLLTI